MQQISNVAKHFQTILNIWSKMLVWSSVKKFSGEYAAIKVNVWSKILSKILKANKHSA